MTPMCFALIVLGIVVALCGFIWIVVRSVEDIVRPISEHLKHTHHAERQRDKWRKLHEETTK